MLRPFGNVEIKSVNKICWMIDFVDRFYLGPNDHIRKNAVSLDSQHLHTGEGGIGRGQRNEVRSRSNLDLALPRVLGKALS